MSGQNGLQRSSWKVEAIRRGDLKISGPIPIAEDTPLNEEEEREFAERYGLDSRSQDALEQQDQRPQSPLQPSQCPPNIPKDSIPRDSDHIEGQFQRRENLRAQELAVSPLRMHLMNAAPQESVVQPSSPVTPTPYRATPESTTKALQKKNRKSGLRNVIRKMLGRKDRDKAEEQEEENIQRGYNDQNNDPGLLRRSPPREMLRQSPPREIQTPSGPRISDMPVGEWRPLHPLGQHLPFPMNVNAPQATPPLEYLNFDHQRESILRSATLPNGRSSMSQRHSVDGSCERLLNWDERQDEDLPSPGIGIALTSSAQARSSIQSKRRSRSADALRDLAKARTSIDRSRSADIRYWRESFASGSTFSLHARPQISKTAGMVQIVQAQEPIIQQQEPVIGLSATLADPDEEDEEEALEAQEKSDEQKHWKEQAPVSAFNFGGLQRGPFGDDHFPESQEPPIPIRSEERISIEDRVKHLESGLQVLESSVHRMSTLNNRQTIILDNTPKTTRSHNRSSSRPISVTSDHEQPIVHQVGGDVMKYIPPSPILVPASELKDSKELVALYETLSRESNARKVLEDKVQTLEHNIADLYAIINRLVASTTMTGSPYTIPSPNTSHHERISRPIAARQNDLLTAGVRESVQSRFSRTDSERTSGEYEQSSFLGHHEDIASPEAWATPSEGVFFHDAIPTTKVV